MFLSQFNRYLALASEVAVLKMLLKEDILPTSRKQEENKALQPKCTIKSPKKKKASASSTMHMLYLKQSADIQRTLRRTVLLKGSDIKRTLRRTMLLKGNDIKRTLRRTMLLKGRNTMPIQLPLRHLKGVSIGMTTLSEWLNMLPRGCTIARITELPLPPKAMSWHVVLH